MHFFWLLLGWHFGDEVWVLALGSSGISDGLNLGSLLARVAFGLGENVGFVLVRVAFPQSIFAV